MTTSAVFWRGAVFYAQFHALVWLSQITVYLVTPVGPQQPQDLVWLYSLLLGAIAGAVPLLIARIYGRAAAGKTAPVLAGFDSLFAQRWLIPVLIGVTALGVALHVYAKLILVDLSYVPCVSHLRFAWLGQHYRQGPFSGLASMLGHILSAFAFPAIFLLLLNRERHSSRIVMWRGGLIFALVVLYALPITSRSVLFFFAAAVLAAAWLGAILSDEKWRAVVYRIVLVPGVVVVGAFLLSTLVFWDRYACPEYGPSAKGFANPGLQYLLSNANGLKLRSKLEDPSPKGGGDLFDNGPVNTVLAPIHEAVMESVPQVGMVGVYLGHGLANFAGAMTFDARPGTAIWLPFNVWLQRLQFPISPAERGVWRTGALTLAGAAWYDYGVAGVIVVGLLLGVLQSMSLALLLRGGLAGGMAIAFILCSIEVIAWSGVAYAVSVFLFPFVAFAAVVTAILAWTGQAFRRHLGKKALPSSQDSSSATDRPQAGSPRRA